MQLYYIPLIKSCLSTKHTHIHIFLKNLWYITNLLSIIYLRAQSIFFLFLYVMPIFLIMFLYQRDFYCQSLINFDIHTYIRYIHTYIPALQHYQKWSSRAYETKRFQYLHSIKKITYSILWKIILIKLKVIHCLVLDLISDINYT